MRRLRVLVLAVVLCLSVMSPNLSGALKATQWLFSKTSDMSLFKPVKAGLFVGLFALTASNRSLYSWPRLLKAALLIKTLQVMNEVGKKAGLFTLAESESLGVRYRTALQLCRKKVEEIATMDTASDQAKKEELMARKRNLERLCPEAQRQEHRMREVSLGVFGDLWKKLRGL